MERRFQSALLDQLCARSGVLRSIVGVCCAIGLFVLVSLSVVEERATVVVAVIDLTSLGVIVAVAIVALRACHRRRSQ